MNTPRHAGTGRTRAAGPPAASSRKSHRTQNGETVMSDQYSLTIVNNSQLPRPTFAVFAQLPGLPSLGSTSLAWLVRQINRGNMYRFTWDIDWGFTWAAQGVSKGYQW